MSDPLSLSSRGARYLSLRTVLIVVGVLALNPLAVLILDLFVSLLDDSARPDFYTIALRRFGLPVEQPRVAVLVVESMVLSDFICDGSCAVERSLSAAEVNQGSRAAEEVLQWAEREGMCTLYVKIAVEGCISERYGHIHPSWCTLVEIPKLNASCDGIDAAFVVNVSAGVLSRASSVPLRSILTNRVSVFDNSTGAQVFFLADSPCKIFASAKKRTLRAPLFDFYLRNTTFLRTDFAGAITLPTGSDLVKQRTRVPPNLRFWTRNFCNPRAHWEHPAPITYNELIASGTNGNLASTTLLKKRCAVVFYVMEGEPERASKFMRLLEGLVDGVTLARKAAAQCDVVVAAAPLDSWADQDRAKALKDALARMDGAKFRTPETMLEEDFSERALGVLSDGQNCCGWTEYQKLGAWNLVEYASVLVLDSDVRLYTDLNEIFSNEEYDFLATPDAVCALNGGFLWLRPNRTTYRAMKKAVQRFDFSRRFGWGKSGPLLPVLPLFSLMRGPYRRMSRNTPPFAIAEETNQGFLFWFFFVQGQQGGAKYRAGMLDQCTYNFNMHRGVVRFLCSDYASNDHLKVRACHKGCARRSMSYSLSLLKFVSEENPMTTLTAKARPEVAESHF